MKKIFQIIPWEFADYGRRYQVSLFNHYVTLGVHFPGCWSWGVEVHFERGCNGVSIPDGYWQLGYGNDNNQLTTQLGGAGKVKSTIIRLGKPHITVHFTKQSRERSLESINLYRVQK